VHDPDLHIIRKKRRGEKAEYLIAEIFSFPLSFFQLLSHQKKGGEKKEGRGGKGGKGKGSAMLPFLLDSTSLSICIL